MQLTEWFDGSKFIPLHVGVYEVKAPDGKETYQNWNGEFWGFLGCSVKDAVVGGSPFRSQYQNLPFRGIKNATI